MENNVITTDNGKTAAVVSYITIIGWLISYFAMYKENKTALSSYHLRQSLFLHLSMIVINIVFTIIIAVVPIMALAYIGWVIYLIYVIFMILGAISANNNEQKPLPIIGSTPQKTFSNI